MHTISLLLFARRDNHLVQRVLISLFLLFASGLMLYLIYLSSGRQLIARNNIYLFEIAVGLLAFNLLLLPVILRASNFASVRVLAIVMVELSLIFAGGWLAASSGTYVIFALATAFFPVLCFQLIPGERLLLLHIIGIGAAGLMFIAIQLVNELWQPAIDWRQPLWFEAILLIVSVLFVALLITNFTNFRHHTFFIQGRLQRLLHNLLPDFIIRRLLKGETIVAEHYENIAILFADIADFTALTRRMPHDALVTMLDQLFREFDDYCRSHGCEKIKTIGDGYMAVKGLHGEDPTTATMDIIKYAKSMMEIINTFNKDYNASLALRIGINTGPVIAGVLGSVRTSFDLWGRSVNLSSRLESQATHNCAVLSEYSYQLVANEVHNIRPKQLTLKGLGEVTAYELDLTSPA